MSGRGAVFGTLSHFGRLASLYAVQEMDGIGEEKGEPLYMPEVPTSTTDSFSATHSSVPEAVATAT